MAESPVVILPVGPNKRQRPLPKLVIDLPQPCLCWYYENDFTTVDKTMHLAAKCTLLRVAPALLDEDSFFVIDMWRNCLHSPKLLGEYVEWETERL